ncbi:LytR C-terminal domain-containing protein [Microbacterium sp. X-17]|uniref:LytR C-terminal domain-containing protein n=1 Tax=Microbacterium sp. X-17 TaxID=3144404 RepID=UPI0031F4EAA1
MPRKTYPRDRFDDLPVSSGRVGAHRAENPRMRGWLVFAWAVVATVVLVALGIFASLIVSGRVTLFPTPVPTFASTPDVQPTLDTSYTVVVLNATGQSGLASSVKDQLVTAGFKADAVFASQAGTSDFAQTTVYYPTAADEAAALGLADLVGGARTELNDAYLRTTDPTAAHQLTLVIGLDHLASPSPTP